MILRDSPDYFERNRSLSPALVAAGIALGTYIPTLAGTFIYDDVDLWNDPRISQPALWGKFFTESYNYGVDNLYRPLVLLSFGIQRQITGDRPMPLHAVNWILHALVSALVAILAVRLSGRRSAGYVAGIAFAVLPIHVEAVANLVGRAELMCAVGVIGALIMLLHRPMTIGRVLAAIGLLVLAIGSKEQGFLLPVLAGLMALCLGIRRPASERERRAMLWLIVLGCWTTAGLIVYRESILKFGWDRSQLEWVQQPLINARGWSGRMMPFALLGRYAALLVWPAELSIDYGGRVIGWQTGGHDFFLWLGLATLLAWMIGVLITWRRGNGAALFCLLATAVLYAMVGNFVVLIGTIFGERLLYLPSAFLCIFLGDLAARSLQRIMVGLLVFIAVWGGLRSNMYARQWNDRLAFYQSQLIAQPLSPRLAMLVAYEQMSEGKLIDAAETDCIARDRTPDYWDLWLQSGKVALAEGEFDSADRYFARAFEMHPGVIAASWRAKVFTARAATQAATKP
ncbi:MAG: hypothetical protein JO353_02775 [Phycisphaerae bacterium]|nr:hypothetical protein [Phycisphaerae bacterium]